MPWRRSRQRRYRAPIELLLTVAVVLVFGSAEILFVMLMGYAGSGGTVDLSSVPPAVLTKPSATTARSPPPPAPAESSATTSSRAASPNSADAAPATPIKAPESH
jgi:hypothetical protein